MDLLTVAHPDRPALDMALSSELLEAVANRRGPEVVRVYRPGPSVAFGRLDRLRPGFPGAHRAAVSHGRIPVLRLGGGRAAAYDSDCVIVEIIRRQEALFGALEARFVDLAELLEDGLARAGVEAERGELAGEYCPGRFSLHLRDGPKIAGAAQRVVSGASLATAVVVVEGGESLRATVAEVYAALAVPVDPATAGAVSDRYPQMSTSVVMAALLDAVRRRHGAVPAQLAAGARERAEALLPRVSPVFACSR